MKKLIFLMIIFLAILNTSYASTNSVTSSNGIVTEGTSSTDYSSGVSGGNPGNDGGMCTMQYDPVCAEINICLPSTSTGGVSNQMCRLGKESKTYGNECEANNAGAKILYTGECGNTGTGTIKACNQEAKLCSDGKTYVSRTGPNCDFSSCPIIIGLSENTKSQLNVSVDKIISISKNQSDESIFIEKIISKLNDMKDSKPKLSRYIDYIISQLQ